MTVLPWRGPVRTRRLPLLPEAVAAVAAAWVAVVAAYAAGRGGWFDHDRATGLLAWQVMTLAMMGPSALPMARYVAANTLVPGRAVAAFAAAYLGVWTAFLAVFALADAVAHAVAAAAEPGPAGTALAFGVAAVWQVTPYKRAALRACRRVWVLPAHPGRAERAAVRLGVRQGAACVVSCGPLMLATMAAAYGRLWLMAAVAALAWVEKAARRERRLAWPSAAVLAALGVAHLAYG